MPTLSKAILWKTNQWIVSLGNLILNLAPVKVKEFDYEEFHRSNTKDLRSRIQFAINCESAENGSNTPDWILAEYLTDCLAAWDKAVQKREKYYGREIHILDCPAPEDDYPHEVNVKRSG